MLDRRLGKSGFRELSSTSAADPIAGQFAKTRYIEYGEGVFSRTQQRARARSCRLRVRNVSCAVGASGFGAGGLPQPLRGSTVCSHFITLPPPEKPG